MQRSADALATFAVAYVAFVIAAYSLPATTAMLVVKQLVCFGAPAVAFAWWRVGNVREGLGLRMPNRSAWAGAVLIGASFWYLNLWITLPVLVRLGGADAIVAANQSAPWLDASVAVRIAAVAIVPAVCEELLLRGVVARSLANKAGWVAAIAISTALFAFLHYPAIRMVPIGLFGIALGFAAVASNSVLPCMVMHLLNNLAAVALVAISPSAVATIESNPDIAGAVALAATGAGAALLWRSRPNPPM